MDSFGAENQVIRIYRGKFVSKRCRRTGKGVAGKSSSAGYTAVCVYPSCFLNDRFQHAYTHAVQLSGESAAARLFAWLLSLRDSGWGAPTIGDVQPTRCGGLFCIIVLNRLISRHANGLFPSYRFVSVICCSSRMSCSKGRE
jgi:hypothetical protein